MDATDRALVERSLRHATEQHTGAALDAALEELGWHDALDTDPRTAVSLLFELQGAAHATSAALDRVVARALRLGTGGGAEGGAGVAAGPGGGARAGVGVGATTGVVLPALGRWTPPAGLDGARLKVGGLAGPALAQRETALVVARTGDGDVAMTVPTTELTLRPVEGLDPWLGLVEVTADAVAGATPPEPVTTYAHGVAHAQLALAHELVGASRAMLGLAREHALERVQFGKPIGSFQAIRHRLADTLVAVETADAELEAAWLDGSPQKAAMAKALAGRGARTAARHCQQVLAGIGFTTEHPLHRHVRRVLVLDQLFGASRTLTRELGEDLLATRRLPRLLPL